MSWIAAALLAALCAGITSILAKCGMRDTDSDIATGIRTAVVLVFAWLVVFVTDAQAGIGNIAPLSWAFLIASGVATGPHGCVTSRRFHWAMLIRSYLWTNRVRQ